MEITLVAMADEGRNTVQEAWLGSGKILLKSVSKSLSDLQCQAGFEPNDRDGMSVSAFFFPAMWSGINGEALLIFNRSDSAQMSCIAVSECFAASRCTQ